jgi:hypothetical protein
MSAPRESAPTAQQLDEEMHAMESSSPPSGLGAVTIDQRDPFHCSTNVLFSEMLPTTMQLLALTQANALKPLPFGLETLIEDQLWPFQCSANATPVSGLGPRLPPTAMHIEGLTHETAASGGDFPLGVTDQLDPFQRSNSGPTVPRTF